MTDLTPPERDEDTLLLDALDGDPEALAIVETQEHLAALLGQMQRNRIELRELSVTIEPESRTSSIEAAMAVFDNITASASASAAETVRAGLQKRRRSQNLFRFLGVAAAGAAVVVTAVAIGPNFGSSDSSDTASNTRAADTTAAPAATTTTIFASPAAGRVSADESVVTENFSSGTTSAPATSVASAQEAAEPLSSSTTGTDAADASDGELAVSETLLDSAILLCADQAGLDITAWISSMPGETPPGQEQRLTSYVVFTDAGFEIDVVLEISTCDFVTVSEPRVPEPAGQ